MSAAAILPDRLAGHDLVIAGDVMLDHFVVGRVDRISPEAPVPVVRFEREEYRLGGAANVAHNVVALGSRARLVGTIGRDDAAEHLSQALHNVHLDDAYLVADKERPTTRKVRVVTSRNQQVARIDYETDADPATATTVALVERMRKAARGSQAIVVSDYRKGVVTRMLLEATFAAAGDVGAPVLVDPKVMQADWYRGASLITPNHHEASLMTQAPVRTDDEARTAARQLHERTGASVVITRGDHGMWILDAAATPHREVALPAASREVADVTGAGDTVIAVLALGLAAKMSLADAAQLANHAAGLVVARFGPVAVTQADLAAAVARSREA